MWYNWILYPLAILGALVVYSTIKNIWKRRKELLKKFLIRMTDVQANNL